MALTNPGLFELAGMSSTLVPQLLLYGGLGLLCALGVLGIFWCVAMARRVQPRPLALTRLHADDGGVVLSADLILVAMPVVIFITLLVQMTWLMRETVIVHYAAFAAARSVIVHRCPVVGAGIHANFLLFDTDEFCESDIDERVNALAAVRYALIPASPPWRMTCMAQCDVPETVLRTLAQQSGFSDRANMLVRQAQYAYDPTNIDLKISIDSDLSAIAALAIARAGSRLPVKVDLTYRHHILRWIGPLLGHDRGDGDYFRPGRAVVRLL